MSKKINTFCLPILIVSLSLSILATNAASVPPRPLENNLDQLKAKLAALSASSSVLNQKLTTLKNKLSDKPATTKSVAGKKIKKTSPPEISDAQADLSKAIVVASSIQAEVVQENKSLYEILGVSKDASPGEITKAYRKLAMKWHPDKWSGASAADQATAEANFKEINMANEALSNKAIRAFYDRTGKILSENKIKEFNDLVDVLKKSLQGFASPALAFNPTFRSNIVTLIDRLKEVDPTLASGFQQIYDETTANIDKKMKEAAIAQNVKTLNPALVMLAQPQRMSDTKFRNAVATGINELKKLDPDLGNKYQEQYDKIIADAQKTDSTTAIPVAEVAKPTVAVSTPATAAEKKETAGFKQVADEQKSLLKDLFKKLQGQLQRPKPNQTMIKSYKGEIENSINELKQAGFPDKAAKYQKQYDELLAEVAGK